MGLPNELLTLLSALVIGTPLLLVRLAGAPPPPQSSCEAVAPNPPVVRRRETTRVHALAPGDGLWTCFVMSFFRAPVDGGSGTMRLDEPIRTVVSADRSLDDP
jgi:hypothetical protein